MATGITLNHNLNGTVKSVTFNWKKYGDKLQALLQEEGVEVPEVPNRATRRAIRAADQGKGTYYKDFDEFKKHVHEIWNQDDK